MLTLLVFVVSAGVVPAFVSYVIWQQQQVEAEWQRLLDDLAAVETTLKSAKRALHQPARLPLPPADTTVPFDEDLAEIGLITPEFVGRRGRKLVWRKAEV